MPYTRNTRIQVTEKLNSVNYKAQVEYRYPLTKITTWVDFIEVPYATALQFMFCDTKTGELAWQADANCINNSELDDAKGLDWAKAQIDEYHKLFDESEYTPIVKYIKYP